ncbi:MAG: hypothetical protein ABL964_13265 [Steroidobacteraceae bacterium]
MDRPSVAHPKPVNWRGFRFQVISYQPFTDEQALKVVEHFIRTHSHELKKKRQSEVIEVRTALSRDEAACLGDVQ